MHLMKPAPEEIDFVRRAVPGERHERDDHVTDDDARKLAELAPQAIVQQLAGVGHLIHWMAPDMTQRLVLSFLESLR